MHYDLKKLLQESGCSAEFIEEAMPYEKLFKGDVEDFIDTVEDILMSDEELEESLEDEDLDDDDEDPIYRSDYDYEGNDDDVYFEDEDGEEPFEDDDDEE